MKKALAIILSFALLICACSFAVYAGTVQSYSVPGWSIRFENSLDWEQVFMYSWDDDGNELCGQWPGYPLVYYDEAENGKDVYSFAVPEGAVGIILSCPGEPLYQTVDITGLYYDSYFYLDGTQDDAGHYFVKDYTEGHSDPVEEPTVEPEPQDRYSEIYITDNLGCFVNAHLYAWDDEGEPIYGEWPGTGLVYSYVDDYGETVYVCPVPENAVGIVINDGDDAQSEDIDDFYSFNGYWFDGTKNELGHYIPTGYEYDPGEYGLYPNNGYCFLNSLAFDDVYEYAYDRYGNDMLGIWPGKRLTYYTVDDHTGYERYPLYYPDGAYSIVLSFNGGAQTEDIFVSDMESSPVCWLDGTIDSSGHYLVSPYSEFTTRPEWYGGSDPAPTEDLNPERKEKLYITDNFGWGIGYIYAWDSNGDDVLGTWPGTMIGTSQNDYGERQFVCDIPKNAIGIIINNGLGAQSSDITNFYNYDGYWFDGSKNEFGQYVAIGYVENNTVPTTAEPTVEPTEEPPENPSEEPTEKPSEKPTEEPTEETTKNNGGIQCTLDITDNLCWGTAYLYAWDSNGDPILGEWPGAEITETYTNGYGENVFICNVPENAAGIVINNGGTETSADITDFSYVGYWFDGTRDDLGQLIPTGYRIDEDEEIPDAPVPEEFYFINSQNFIDVYLYAFDADGNSLSGDWPGSNKDEIFNVGVDTTYDVYYIDLPYNTYGFILSDGSSQRTEEVYQSITYKNAYWLDGSKDDYGNFLFKSYSGSIVPTTNPKPEYKEVYVNDDLNWEEGYMYAWDEYGNNLTEQWPGDQVNKININGNVMFVCDVPVNAKGFILSDNGKSKTIDTLDFDSYNAYRILNETDTKGNHKVEGYNFEYQTGDVNGDSIISVADATMVQQHAAELITLTGNALASADTNRDGIVSVYDATLIQQYAAEIIDSFDV